MQTIFIAGNVGKDGVVRQTQGGDAVLGFSVAVDNGKDSSGNRRDSTWYDCSLWGKRANSLAQYVTKGTKLSLMGRPSVRVHEGKAYLQISVDQLTFQGGGQQSDSQQSGGYQAPANAGGGPGAGMDDSIPFGAETRL